MLMRTTDRKYVARFGSEQSYTKYLQHAQVFATRDEAEKHRCPGNERIVELDSILGTTWRPHR